jgi:hypothetical protein
MLNSLVMSANLKSTGPSNTAFSKKAAPPTFMPLKSAPTLNALSSNNTEPANLAFMKIAPLLN